MSVQERRKYDSCFKHNAVQLTKEPGWSLATVPWSLCRKNPGREEKTLRTWAFV